MNLEKPLEFKMPLKYDRTITDISSYTNVLLIDEHIIQSNIFYTSCNNTTFPILYSSFCSSSDVFDLISKFNNNVRLAFVFDHTIGRVNYLFDGMKIFNNTMDNSNVLFILDIILQKNITHIDYLACNTMNDNTWTPYYGLLKSKNVIIGCSSNFTGNMVGDDWIMESTNENIKNLYFTDNINNYTSHLGDYYIDISKWKLSSICY